VASFSEASEWVVGGTVSVEDGAAGAGAGGVPLSGSISPSLNSMQSAVATVGFRRNDMLGGAGSLLLYWYQQGAGRKIRMTRVAATKTAVNRAVA
jgi:hypothetical protein